MLRTRLLTSSAFLLVALLTAHADSNWPRFRGPNGTGTSSGKHIPVQWSERDVLWKVPIEGAGHSSPVIWGDRIFLQSASRDGGRRFLVCLDAASGRILWSRSAPGSRARKHERNSLASSTPATDGKRVYALFWNGTEILLSAYDLDGQPVWERNLGAFYSQHGAGASPIVHNDLIILSNDQDASSTLIALRADSGKTVWQVSRTAIVGCYSTPFLLERPAEAPQLIVGSTAGVTGYDPPTGRELWNWRWIFAGKPLRTVASPVYGADHVFLTSGDGGGDREMVAIKLPGGRGSKPSLSWQSRRTFPYVPTMLTVGEHLYWVSDLGIAGCHNARTGANLWTQRLGGNFSASPILVEDRIYAPNEDGDVYVFRAAPQFQLLAKNSIGELVRATPAVDGNRLFIRGEHHLFCIGDAGDR